MPPRMRPQDGRVGTRRPRRSFVLWMWSRRKAARMLLPMLLRPEGFREGLLRTRLYGGRMSGAATAYEANGRPAKDVAFHGHTWLLRGVWGCCLRIRPLGGRGGERGLPPADEAMWLGGRRARKYLLTFGLPIEGGALCHIVCVCVLCPVLDAVKSFWDTTGWTPDFFGRQSEEALLAKKMLSRATSLTCLCVVMYLGVGSDVK